MQDVLQMWLFRKLEVIVASSIKLRKIGQMICIAFVVQEMLQ